MEGVTILNQELLTTTEELILKWAATGVFAAVLIVLFILFTWGEDIGTFCLSACIFALPFILIVLMVVGNITETQKLGKYEYEVTIGKTVSMQEFNEKYEIKSQRGDIYTIIERENK